MGGWRSLVAAFAALLVLGGCSAFPVNGPNSMVVKAAAAGVTEAESAFAYELVVLRPESIDVLNASSQPVLSGSFQDRRRSAADINVGIGDVVSVTIFEATAGGLFIPAEAGSRAGNFVALPNQVVDRTGMISVPYAGTVKADGRTPSQIQETIVERLRTRAIEPQALVAVADQRSQVVAVLGEVNLPARLPVTTTGERLLDSISRAGGIKGNGIDLFVRLVRGGKQGEVHMPRLTSDPRNNIFTQPGDTIYVYRNPPSFTAFGASGSQGQFGFDVEKLSLAEGIAKAGGLLDDRADPGAVYIYRKEPREVAARLGIDVSRYGTTIPIIYSINFREPRGFFVAQRMLMRDKDVLFVSNAQSVEVTKFLQFLRIATAAVREVNASSLEVER